MKIHKKKIRASWIRGGTSKGVFFYEEDLPKNEEERDSLILSVMGSPDPSGMQLNGLGGGISSTSKVAIISKSERKNIDVNYLFGHVRLKESKIDWKGSCGNLAAGVALYAIEEKLVQTQSNGSAKVSIWQENLNHEIRVKVYPPNDQTHWVSIPGVPGESSAMYVEFINPNSSLLPNNQPFHRLHISNEETIEATLICGVNPTIFVHASAMNLKGDELPKNVDFPKMEKRIEHICQEGAKIMQVPYTSALRLAWVSPPKDHTTSDGSTIYATNCDLISRISTEGRIHHAYTGTGAINLACAAKIPGSIPYQIVKNPSLAVPLKIANPLGVIQVDANVVQEEHTHLWIALSAGFIRTAKILMVGNAYI
jgi:2-methylaconitate cis-trans-isomerase PrpF